MMQESNTPSFYQRFPPVRSSKLLGWKGIEAAQYLASPGQVSVPSGLSSHLLILYLGEPNLIVQTGSTPGRDTLADTFVRKGAHAFVSTERGLGGRWSMDIDALFLHFDPALIRSIIEASDLEASRVELLSHSFLYDHSVEQFGLALLHELYSSGFNTRLYAESLANALTLHLLRHFSTLQNRELRVTSDLGKTRLRHVLDYMHEYYTRDLSIAELAAVASVSSSHFAQLFRKTMGMAPHEYLIACRVEHAKRLLLTQDISLHEVASHSGFADQSHLTRHFRQSMGVTPGVFRKERRNVL
jgi:AraC family transcriptional regulator